MSGKLLFQLPGINPCDAAWQNRGGNVLAVATPEHIRLWDRSGRVLHEQKEFMISFWNFCTNFVRIFYVFVYEFNTLSVI